MTELERVCARVLCFAQDCTVSVVYEDSVLRTNSVAVADVGAAAEITPELYRALRDLVSCSDAASEAKALHAAQKLLKKIDARGAASNKEKTDGLSK
jgi:hypothetical protein